MVVKMILNAFSTFLALPWNFIYKRPLNPDIIHLHDWQTAVIAAIYQDMYHKISAINKAKTVLTIHNMEYQGQVRSA